jgi:transketolase
MPCLERFMEQEDEYRNTVLGDQSILKVVVESAIDSGWSRWIGPRSRFIGMDDFGITGPGDALFKHFGLDAEGIARQVISFIQAESD